MTQPETESIGGEVKKAKVRRIQAEDFQFYVRQIYRLFRVSTMHLLNNDAVTKLVEQTAVYFGQLREAELDRLNILFVDKTVFVNGQLLKADPDVYQLSIKLAVFIQRLGFNELSIAHDVTEDDLRSLMGVFVGSWTPKGPEERDEVKFKRVKLRRVKSEVLDLLRIQAVSPRERLVRTYASALIVMRHAWQRLLESQPPSLKAIKRVVQQMVRESSENPIAFQVLARMRNVHDDPAGQAVKQAMVTIAMMRPLTDDVKVLARGAMASLHFDLGRPRALGARGGSTVLTEGPLPAPTSEQRQAFPEETVLAGLIAAQIHPDALERVVVAFEGQHIAIDADRVPMPATASLVDLEPFFIVVARRYTEAMAFDVSTQRHMDPHEAITWMVWNCRNKVELLITRLLAIALRIEVADDLFSSSVARKQGVTLENREYSLPGKALVERNPDDASRTAQSSANHGVVNPQRTDRYDPLHDEQLIRRAQSASNEAVNSVTGEFDAAGSSGGPLLRSALSGNEKADDLLDPFFRERTGSFRTLTSQHRTVEPAPDESTSETRASGSQTSARPASHAEQSAASETPPTRKAPPALSPSAEASATAPGSFGERHAPAPMATPPIALKPLPAEASDPPSDQAQISAPGQSEPQVEKTDVAAQDGPRAARLAELAKPGRLSLSSDPASESTSKDRMAAAVTPSSAARVQKAKLHDSGGPSHDTQMRLAALAVAVEASQQKPVRGQSESTVVVSQPLRPQDPTRVTSSPSHDSIARQNPGAGPTVVAAQTPPPSPSPEDATRYVPVNRYGTPGSPYFESSKKPPATPDTASDKDSPVQKTSESEDASKKDTDNSGTLVDLLSDYLKGD